MHFFTRSVNIHDRNCQKKGYFQNEIITYVKK